MKMQREKGKVAQKWSYIGFFLHVNPAKNFFPLDSLSLFMGKSVMLYILPILYIYSGATEWPQQSGVYEQGASTGTLLEFDRH